LLSKPVESDSDGNFSIPASYFCPSASSQLYVVARGGIPGLASGADNSAIALMTMVGACGSLSGSSTISVNEATTIGSVWPLSAYMKSATDLGSAPGDAAFISAASSVHQFVNIAQGISPGMATPESHFAQSAKLYSLADVLDNCVNSAGGSAGDGSPCGSLFSMATPATGGAPSDTVSAAMRIAQGPYNEVSGIFGLIQAPTAFQPTLTAIPADWTLSLSHPIETPTISLATGNYVGSQTVTMSESTAGSKIYYTTDGTVPTSSSSMYSGPISIDITSTIQAIAVDGISESALASSTLTITSATAASTAAKLAFLQQPSNALIGVAVSPAVRVVVEDVDGKTVGSATNLVTVNLTGVYGLGGTLEIVARNGVAIFNNLTVSTAGSYTLTASSLGLGSVVSTSFAITAPSVTGIPAKLAFLQQPSNALAGAQISPAVQVAVEDANGNVVTNGSNPVALALTGGTSLAGTLPSPTLNGIATFNNLSVGAAGIGYTLSVTSPGLATATSTPFTISETPVLNLRELAALRGILIGSGARSSEFNQPNPLVVDPVYGPTLAAQYGMLEGENAMKWFVLEPHQNQYDFGPGDTLVTFAKAHTMKVRGHTLCWGSNNPAWLSNLSTQDLSNALHTFISTVVSHYGGDVFAWDVVNEAISDQTPANVPMLKDSIWYNSPGIGLSGTLFIEQAFRWAHQANPNAKLFYNDYGIEVTGPKSQALLVMLKDFKARGVPIDGVGLQMHVDTKAYYPTTFPAALKTYTDLGLEVHISEMDVKIAVDSAGHASEQDLQEQANTYGFVVTTCLQNPRCTAFQSWGFTDKYSWIPQNYPGYGAALPYGTDYSHKLAYAAIAHALTK
jgi:endo-1,4-beta-xylanase